VKSCLLLLLLAAAPASAQVLQLDAGASTLYNASGATATLYTPNSTITAGVGYSNGHVILNASDTWLFRGATVTVGDKQFGFSFDGVGLGLAVKGLSFTKQTDSTTVTAFAGLTGAGIATPYITAVRAQNAGAGFFIVHKFHGAKLYSLEALDGGKYTAAQGITYQYGRTLGLAASGGVLNGTGFFNGAVSYKPAPAWNFSAAHESYLFPDRATGNNAGFSFTPAHFSLQGSWNESTYRGLTVVGETIGAGVRVGPVIAQSNVYHSGNKTFLTNNVTEKIQHLTFTQTETYSAQQSAWAFGGGYTSNRMSVSLNHSIIFLLNGEGFQQVTGISVSLRLHDTTLNASTVTTPFGKTLWTGYATDYVQIGDAVPGVTVRSHVGGRFIIAGVVRDASGAPVSGAAVEIGKDIAYTDAAGAFSVRARTAKPQALAVLPAVFAAPGAWVCVDAPASVAPGTPINIVVKRGS
jgi:hypothetical protein